MVRVKYRYLVVNFLYPAAATTATTQTADGLPELLQFHAPTPDAFHTGQLLRVIRDGVADSFGDYGSGVVKAALKVNYWSPATSTAIVRCPREHYDMVWAALTFITKLPKPADTLVVAKVIRVSGTIRKAEEEVIRRAKLLVQKAKTADKGTAKDQIMQGVVKSVDRRTKTENAVLAQVDKSDENESEDDSE